MFTQKVPVFLAIIICIVAMLAISMYKQGHWWGDDFALYIHQADALCNNTVGKLVETNRFAIDNSSMKGFSPTLAPWGLPVLLAPVLLFAGVDVEAFKGLIILCYLGFLLVYFMAFRKSVPAYALLGAVLLMGTNISFLNMLNNVQSEIPYLLFALTSLWVIHAFLEKPDAKRGIVLGFLIWFTFQIRTEGLLWLAALFAGQVVWVIRNRATRGDTPRLRVPGVMLLPYIIFALFFGLGSLVLPNGFVDHAGRIDIPGLVVAKGTVNMYFSRFSMVLTAMPSTLLQILVLILFLAGLVYRFKKDAPAATYTLLVMLLFIVWPFREFRYAMLLFPFIFYFVLQGMLMLAELTLPVRARPVPVMLLLLACLLGNVRYLVPELKNRDNFYAEGPETPDSREMFSYIRQETAVTDTVIFFRPRAMALYTKRKSAMIFDSWPNLMRRGTYYVFDKEPNTICQFSPEHPFMRSAQFAKHFSRVFENNGFIVYLIQR